VSGEAGPFAGTWCQEVHRRTGRSPYIRSRSHTFKRKFLWKIDRRRERAPPRPL